MSCRKGTQKMSERKVLLNIRSLCNGEENLNLICDGVLSEKDGGYRISWDGSESLGKEGEENSVEIYGDDTFIFGIGDGTPLMLGKNRTCAVSDFDLGSGGVPVQFFVSDLKNTLNDNGGNVILDYSVSTPLASSVSKRFELAVIR